MHDEADRYEVVVEVVEERPAAGGVVERPAERMLHQTGPVPVGRDLPELLQAQPEFLRLAAAVEAIARNQRFGERAARTLGEQRVFAAKLHAASEVGAWRAILGDAHVSGGDADH